MQHTIEYWNARLMESYGFTSCEEHPYGLLGTCWKMAPEMGAGCFWIYGEKDLFDIKIHDFYFHKDTLVENNVSGYLSVVYYDSISGEQLTPYRRTHAGCIQSTAGNKEPYKIWVYKKIPIRSAGIGIAPVYYKDYIKKNYPEEYFNPFVAFFQLDQEANFPELVILLKQMEHYRGEGMAAKLFYEGKVAEVVSTLLSRLKNSPKHSKLTEISMQDLKHIELVAAYVNDHYVGEIPLEELAGFACMSLSEFKLLFQSVYHCSVISYIRQRRMSHAECLLTTSDLTIGQIAKSVGYSTSSRLSELFHQSIGLTPAEYQTAFRKAPF